MPQTEEIYSNTTLTRYVEHPGLRRAIRAGRRNLAWGIAFLIAALSVGGIALFVGGPRALVPPALFLVCFTALWVLARIKVFSQRNGVFFAIAVVLLLGAGAALIEQAWPRLQLRAGFTASSAPGNPANGADSTTSFVAAAPELPFLTDRFQIEEPSPSLPRVRASRDFTAQVGGKNYRVHKGEIFQLSDEKNGEFVVHAGEFLARVPVANMDQLAPESAKPTASATKAAKDDGKAPLEKAVLAKVTQRAQAEAMKRFPGLGQKGSNENKLFLDAYNELKRIDSEILADPEWPMHLAEILAQRYTWKEEGVIDPTVPEVVEPTLAPGAKMLADPTEAPESPSLTDPANDLPDMDSEIPPPPKGPQPE
jgi:hypothetical protein